MVNRVNIDAKREQVSRGLIKFNTETPSNSSSVQPSGEVQYMSNMNATYAAKNTGKVVKVTANVICVRDSFLPFPFLSLWLARF